MKKFWKAACLLFASIMLFGACSTTETANIGGADAPTDINVTSGGYTEIPDKLIIGVDDKFPPMGFRDDAGEIVGFDIDLANAVAERLGTTVEIQTINWKMKETELNDKNIDIIWNGYTISDERKEQVLFSEPYLANNQVIVVKKGSGLDSFASLAGKKVGLQAGSTAVDALDSAAELKASLSDVVEFQENAMAFMDLDSGGVDAVAVDEVVAEYYIAKDHFDFEILSEKLMPEEYGIGFRKEDTFLCEEVNRVLNEMHEDGSLAEISEKWFGKDITLIGQ